MDARFGPLPAEPHTALRVAVLDPGRNLFPFAQGSGADWLLRRLAGPGSRVVDLGIPGTCMPRAVVDCPAAGSTVLDAVTLSHDSDSVTA